MADKTTTPPKPDGAAPAAVPSLSLAERVVRDFEAHGHELEIVYLKFRGVRKTVPCPAMEGGDPASGEIDAELADLTPTQSTVFNFAIQSPSRLTRKMIAKRFGKQKLDGRLGQAVGDMVRRGILREDGMAPGQLTDDLEKPPAAE